MDDAEYFYNTTHWPAWVQGIFKNEQVYKKHIVYLTNFLKKKFKLELYILAQKQRSYIKVWIRMLGLDNLPS